MQQQRVLLVVRRLRTGGIEKATLNLAQGLLAAGHSVHLLLLKGKNELPLPDGLQLHQYDMDKKVKLAKLKAEIRNKFGYKVIEETIDCEKEKGKDGKVVRRTYLRI